MHRRGGSKKEAHKDEVDCQRRILQQQCFVFTKVLFKFVKSKFKIIFDKCPTLAAALEAGRPKEGARPTGPLPIRGGQTGRPGKKSHKEGGKPQSRDPPPKPEGQGQRALCPTKKFPKSTMMPTPLVKGVWWGHARPPPKLHPGDAVQEVPVHKATLFTCKSLFLFLGSRRKAFRGLSFPPPG